VVAAIGGADPGQWVGELSRINAVEAGLRSGDRSMPEELNRLLTDQLADLHFTTKCSAAENLAREGIDAAKVHFVGNTMIDTPERLLPRARGGEAPRRLGLTARGYGLVTSHRPSNVDDLARLEALVAALRSISAHVPLVWPVHPRTRARLDGVLDPGGGEAAGPAVPHAAHHHGAAGHRCRRHEPAHRSLRRGGDYGRQAG